MIYRRARRRYIPCSSARRGGSWRLASIQERRSPMMRRWQSFLGVGLLLLAAPASGSTFLHMSRAELAKKASAVVVGNVLSVESFWTRSGQIIVTEAMVEVEDAILGETPSVVIVRTFGGTVNGYTVEAHGFPTFNKGERLLLFLEKDRADPGATRVLGSAWSFSKIGRAHV